ncbi:4-hydroxybenzoate octaprenyltransferase [Coxiella endosymbiont of Amblyomma nuttalli]|uniref:4-hydroxybenzoate octaprenyltransferase n=1 Tax=Coxiella endosymbiont of Amblyomma nuttalli TaxID=2749996 RepID=UPI001BA56B40|nr:4-hydroxybenzoate octaprenyltransferase [Coxiella endosymbiont of Amblyomma nuttalli]QTS83569.1 4-hydroxybenzoate octaprenyltransferase [Coxiella endosymbiont of Amblyomma nuttalli]
MINIRHYFQLMRFDKPIGIFLLLWPTLWALWLAAGGIPSLKILVIFILGVVIMRAAGCVMNDLIDRNIDKYVQRTQLRPLAVGTVGIIEAIMLFGILCLFALVLAGLLNRLVIELAIVGIILIVIYPFLKRVTYLTQFWLGLTFSWGVPIAFAAEQGVVPKIAWFLFVTAVLWPITYDTQYAIMDREDDFKIGVKSMAILFGHYDRLIIGLLQGGMLLLFGMLGMFLSLNYWFYLGLLIALGFMIYQQVLIRYRKPENCFAAFRSNNYVGLVIFLGIFLTYI